MVKRYNNISLLLGIPGIIAQIIGQFMNVSATARAAQAGSPPSGNPGAFLLLLGTIALVVGLAFYAKAKGRSHWWGLCGLLSILGLIILACLKDESGRSA